MRLPKKPPSILDALSDALKENPGYWQGSMDPVIDQTVSRANAEGWNWEDCTYRAHLAKTTPIQLWAAVKMSRSRGRVETPILDRKGRPFSYLLPPTANRILHRIDTQLGGVLGSTFPQVAGKDDEKRYLLSSLREEAISSSLIEGAVATRQQAAEMIRSERKPKNHGERMILNNYRTIQYLNGRRRENLTPGLLCEVQRLLTLETLDKPDAAGRFRRDDENIAVWDDEDQQILHDPPPAVELPERLAKLCRFANSNAEESEAGGFTHPAIRAIILHFWLAYDHPFVDGNGRSARALFYWSMLRQGYWLAEYLSISSIIAGHPKQYVRAYVNTEQDENDLTYFILYHLDVIERSLKAFREYLDSKTEEQTRNRWILAGPFNTRQRALLLRALKDPNTLFSYESHANSHGVTIYTARADLLELEKLKLLKGNRKGRRFEFVAVPNIRERLEALAGRESA
jgi:Fic family protein